MISNINIQRLRGISECTVNNLGRINLFVGHNNCGKSTFLEAIFLLTGGTLPINYQKINDLRNCRLRNGEDFRYNFYAEHIDEPITISADSNKGHQKLDIAYTEQVQDVIEVSDSESINSELPKLYGIDFRFSTNGNSPIVTTMRFRNDKPGEIQLSVLDNHPGLVSAWLISPAEPYSNVEEYFAKAVENKQEGIITEVLKRIEPSIHDISVAGSRILVDVGFDKRIPIQLMGDGLKKILSVIVNMSMAKDGILLIDEIDNGLHFSSMPILWKAIVESAQRYNVQVFATTHNIESIRSLNDVLEEYPEMQPQFKSYTLRKRAQGVLDAIEASYNQFNHIINQELELR